MEVLVRIADEKYLKYKIVENLFEAVKLFKEKNFGPYLDQYDSQRWRDTVYWKEENDICLKFYKPIIENIYKHNSSKKVKPG